MHGGCIIILLCSDVRICAEDQVQTKGTVLKMMKKKLLSMLLAFSMLVSVFGLQVFADGETEDPKFAALRANINGLAAVVEAYGDRYNLDTKISYEDMTLMMSAFYNENPQFSYLSNAYSYYTDGDKMVTAIVPRYTVSVAEAEQMKRAISDWVTGVVSGIPEGSDDLERAVYLHDYIIENFDYDTTYEHRTLYDFITLGVGVCQAYTYAYTMLLNAVGIGVSWASSSEMNHVWNLVKLDGKWYHADLTWDDPVNGVVGKVSHSYFLLSDTLMMTSYNHYGWVSPYTCTDEKYDPSYIRGITSAFNRIGDSVYYFGNEGIYKTEDISVPGQLFYTYSMRWNVWGSQNVYTDNYSTLTAVGSKLYFNSSTAVMSLDTSGNALEPVYTYNGGDGYIYGFRHSNIHSGKVDLYISKSPDSPGKYVSTQIFSTSPSTLRGDADGDGRVTVGDAILILKRVAGWSGIVMRDDLADSDGNGSIGVNDAIVVLKIVAGWDI